MQLRCADGREYAHKTVFFLKFSVLLTAAVFYDILAKTGGAEKPALLRALTVGRYAMTYRSDFGERLKNLRKSAGITQQELADRLNVHVQTVSKWERGLFEPDFSMLGELSAILGVPLERLLGGSEEGGTYSGSFSAAQTGRALATARRTKGESQEEVAAAAGVSADIVSKWERGVICPDMEQFFVLSSHFAVPASKLYFGITDEDKTYTALQIRRRVRISVAAVAALFLLAAAIILAAALPRAARPSFTVTVDGTSYTVVSDELFSCAPSEREGYKFEYFKDSTGAIVNLPVKITADCDLAAVYSPCEYNIDYWLNGGSFTVWPQYTFNVESGAVQLPVPQKSGAEFMGWYLQPDYSGEPVGQVECSASDIKVYAKWSDEVYTVRYELNGGSLSQSNPSSVTAAEEYELFEPLRGGYVFLGWFDSPEGGTRYQSVGGAGAKTLRSMPAGSRRRRISPSHTSRTAANCSAKIPFRWARAKFTPSSGRKNTATILSAGTRRRTAAASGWTGCIP